MDTALKIPDDQYRQWIAELSKLKNCPKLGQNY